MRLFFWALTLAAVTATAQKTISLEDAVLQQGRKFRADRMTGFQWIPNSQSYTYLADSGKQLMSASAANTTAKELVSLADVNAATGAKFSNFGTLKWIDASNFIMTDGRNYYSYNTQSKSGKKLAELPENADNAEFDDNFKNVAFTKD